MPSGARDGAGSFGRRFTRNPYFVTVSLARRGRTRVRWGMFGGRSPRELIRLRSQLDAALCEALAQFDESGGWAADGATSLIAWLRFAGLPDAARFAPMG